MTPSLKTQLSSELTFFLKFIFPVFWLGMSIIALVVLFNTDRADFDLVLGILLVSTPIVLWMSISLKRVCIEEENLVVSNYLRTICIPITNISGASEIEILRPHPIWIHFIHTTGFGSKIVFIPANASFFPLRSHPVVELLNNYARKNLKETDVQSGTYYM